MKKIVTVRHHVLINHIKGHSLALNSHSSKKYSGIHGLKGGIYILTIPRLNMSNTKEQSNSDRGMIMHEQDQMKW